MNIKHFTSIRQATQLIGFVTLLLTAGCGLATICIGKAIINEINIQNSNLSIEFLTLPYIQQGWPQKTRGSVDSSPVLGDLDDDGELEVIIGSSDWNIYAWNPDGTLVEGWPVETGFMVRSSPALGDIDGDKDIEVIVGSMDGHVYAWHHNGTLVNGWPIKVFEWIPRDSIHYGRTSSPVLGDIDNDGIQEIVIGTFEGPVYIWNGDGTPLDGWPQIAGEGAMSSPALGDLDNDGQLEIICGSFGGNVYVWTSNGTLVAGWPQLTEYVDDKERTSSPALGDLDGDNDLEIVIGSHKGPVYAWHHNGTPVLGWPQRDMKSGTHSSPALGDINGDGSLEIIIGSKDYNVYAWHLNGTLVSGWPQQTRNINELVNAILPGVLSCPALADIDNDGDIEIIVGSSDFNVYAWHHTGELVHGWPIATSAPVISSPALNDIDGDSRIEIVIGSWDYNVYVWEVESPFDLRKAPWSMFRANPSHTGVFQDIDGDGLKDTDELDRYYTDPYVADDDIDTDQDGLPNVAEVDTFRTDPQIADTDGDGLKDGEEVFQYKTDPINPDTDKDELSDGDEVVNYDTDPTTSDTDLDGLSDYEEVIIYGTSPISIDTDGDGLRDTDELDRYYTDPFVADDDIDTDQDGLPNVAEVDTFRTDPQIADTDGDGLKDGEEVFQYKTDPINPDTDKDGFFDGKEVEKGSDPLIPELVSEFQNWVLMLLGCTLILVLLWKRQN